MNLFVANLRNKKHKNLGQRLTHYLEELTPKPNLTKQEMKGLLQLRKDKNRLILAADKGVAMVVMDKEDYINKAKKLLGQQAYKRLDKDPTNRIKAKLITKLRTI